MDKNKALIKKALMEKKVDIVLKAWYQIPTKISKESIKARQVGNQEFKKCNHTAQTHEKIWSCYSRSIAKAPIASEDLAAAYSNRSAFLLHIQKFNDSIADINRALQITQINCLKVKLLCRKIQCFSALNMDGTENILDQAKYWFCKVEQKDKDLLIKIIEKTKAIVRSNDASLLETEFPSKILIKDISDKINSEEILKIQNVLKINESTDPLNTVSLKYSEKYGRHLIANRDIKPGEIINISRPYVTALNLNNFYAFCGHCLKTSWASIPCDYCSWCMFCSEECKNEAWKKYHDIECQMIPYIKFNQTSDYWKQIGLKLTIMSVKEAGGIEELKKELKKIDNYKTKSTNFFGTNMKFCSTEDLLENEDVLFIGSLLLKFFKISDINTHCVMEGSSDCRFENSIEKCQINRCCERGICLATVPSFLNHSCYPTVRKCFTEDMQLIIYALQPIKKNEQLFDSYIGCYFSKTYNERKKQLEEFNFECDCLPCKEQWPTINLLQSHLNYVDKSNNSTFETALLTKYESLIECKDGKLFNLNALNNLSKDIEEAKKKLSEPSYAMATLISTLWTIFDYVYGIRLTVTDKCNKI
ncbi:uncharacterized protein LOC131675256 isoform X2 [Phymastichus coffea]|uniref:uncharacterized protein LOC131675256 isoform X2 n=1 Tax=Phymastichus coffea TaxID=108790 RepID=UPI00273C6F43|nr:uncharacterized protein LOC131675256 isoform X2 [Phymastichus coffea]